MENRIWNSRAVSPTGADKSGDCLSEYQQIMDGAW